MEEGREVIFEIRLIGDIKRVAAIDVETGVEVVLQAPAAADDSGLQAIALRKLERALAREGEGEEAPSGQSGKLI